MPWLRAALDVARLGCFVVFVFLGLWATGGRGGAARQPPDRRRLDRLLLYVLIVTGVVGLAQRESWPFTHWALVHGLSPKIARSWAIEGLDASGRGYTIDPRVVEPLAPEEFGAWMLANDRRLGLAGRAEVARYLLERAEVARERMLRGGRVGSNEWLLGPLAAPYHFLLKTAWRSPADVPATPFTGLRVWEVEWDVRERVAHGGPAARRLVFEFTEGR